MIDTFQIDTKALLAGNKNYTKLSKSSNAIYDIEDVLEENQDIKQMLINFLKIHEISKEFVISQTDFFDTVFNKIVENLRLGIKDRANNLKQIKKDFLSFLSLNAYRNSFTKRGEKVPFGPEFLYTNLVDRSSPNDTISKTLSQQLEELLNDPETTDLINNNMFIKTIRSETNKVTRNDINLLSKNEYAISIFTDLITADTRKKIDPDLRKRIVNGFRELMVSPNSKIRQFADNLFYYTIVKDGMQFKNSSFIKYIPAEMYQDYSDILEKLNTALRNNLWESNSEMEGLENIVGMTKKEIEDSFISLFARDPENRDLFKSVTSKDMYDTLKKVNTMLNEPASIFTTDTGAFSTNGNHDVINVDVSKVLSYNEAEIEVFEDENNGLPLLTFIYKNELLDQISTSGFYNSFERFVNDSGQEYIRKVLGYSDYNQFYKILNKEKELKSRKVNDVLKNRINNLTSPIIKNTPFDGVYDSSGIVTGLQFPLFFVLEVIEPGKSSEEELQSEEDISQRDEKSRYETFILTSFDGLSDDAEMEFESLEEKNKFKYKGLKAKYVKVDNIHTSIYNYLYTPQEYKHLMLRLLEMQKQMTQPLTKTSDKSAKKANIQIISLNQIEQVFAESKDSFTYNLEMIKDPQSSGGPLLKVVEDFKSNNDSNTFSKSEENILSKRLFGNERFKIINDNTLSVNLLSESDSKHLSDDNILIKPVTNNDVISRLNLNINETALVKINNNVYKVTSKGVTNPYNVVSDLGLNKKDIKNELSSFTSEYDSDMNNWLGYDKTTNEYLPFKGKPTQIYQIEPYYENKISKLLENSERPNYGVNEVITVFSDNESGLSLHGIEVKDEVNTEGYIPKLLKLYRENNPNILVVFDDGSSYIQSAINLKANNNLYDYADKVTNPQKGIFVIDVKNNISDQIKELKDFFIANNIPNVYNKVMIVKSEDDKTNYNDYIKDAFKNKKQAVGLPTNLSENAVISEIVNKLRKLGYFIKVDDILDTGNIDILPSLLTSTDDGKNVYTYILQKFDEIKAEIDMNNRKKTTLSDKVKNELKNIVTKKKIVKNLPHNMKHQKPDKNGLSMSMMRDDITSQNIFNTFDAIINYLRTQTSRSSKEKAGIEVEDIVRVTAFGRAPIYVKITNISNKTISENLADDYSKLGIKYDPKNLKAEDLQRSEYAKEWSRKQGWDISYFMFNMDSLKDKYDIDFEYIPNIEEYAKEAGIQIIENKFGWTIDNKFGDRNKALNSNGFIGYIDVDSRYSVINTYLKNASNQGIPTNDNLVVSPESEIFVSVPGNDTMSKAVKDKILKKASEVLEAGGTLLMSDLIRANNKYNKSGEGVILKELYDRFNNLTNSNMLNYTKYSLPNFEKDLETDGQINRNCK
jgi:hypothetical protein